MNKIFSVAGKIIGLVPGGNLLTMIPAIIGFAVNFSAFLHTAIVAAEQPGVSGQDKLTAVLNAANAFVTKELTDNGFAGEAKSFSDVAVEVEQIIEEIVGLLNNSIWKKL